MASLPVLRVDPADSVATALRDIAAGERIELGDCTIVAADPVPSGHKVALRAHVIGAPVTKFGFPIGEASAPIPVGAFVHSHNLVTALRGEAEYRYTPALSPTLPTSADRRFLGYRRADGRAATRNEIWVLPTVGCVGRTAQKIADRANATHIGRVDGVYAFAHPFGCSQLGDDLAGTRAILAALASHPNAGGVLLVGLGCESNQLAALLSAIPGELHHRIRTLSAQAAGDEIDEGLALVDDLVAQVANAPRVPLGLDQLVLGVKCGGSDGLSGLTANPLIGRMSDTVAGAGGKVILTEIPEIFGAEQLLMARAADAHVFDRTVAVVNRFKRYFLDHGEPVSENPSPGNIAGGITTLEEKSLGAVQKAGRAALGDVLAYGDMVSRHGLSLLEAPGNDAVSSTALCAAGATVLLFSTGRGTPLGFPVPTIKISSNTALAQRKPGWIDFDAGQALGNGLESAADSLLDMIVDIASGAPTAAEKNAEREIAIWKRGVTL